MLNLIFIFMDQSFPMFYLFVNVDGKKCPFFSAIIDIITPWVTSIDYVFACFCEWVLHLPFPLHSHHLGCVLCSLFWVKFWRSWSQFHFTSSTVVFLPIVHCRLLPTVVSYSLSTVVSAVAFSLETKSDSVLCCKPVSVLLTAWFHKMANKDSIDYKL